MSDYHLQTNRSRMRLLSFGVCVLLFPLKIVEVSVQYFVEYFPLQLLLVGFVVICSKR